MKKSRSCLWLAFLSILLVLLAAVGYLIVRGASKVNVEASLPPTIIVNSPTAGESIAAGSFLLANVTATGQNPIARIELWLDGSLLETQIPGTELGEVTTFYATASIPMTEGPHMFSARAVDVKGHVGQSLPVSVQGSPNLSENGGDASQPQPTPPGQSPSQPPSGNTPSQPPVAILPPAPLPITPAGVTISSILEYKPIDLSSLLPIFISLRPKAPTSLQAGFENCTIRLVWMDNADTEKYFNVWMQALGGPPTVIATLKGSPQTGPAWYEFASPSFGIYSFWIEAVNGLGGQSSEIAWVGVNDRTCGPGVATHLNIEIVDMYVPGGYDQVYCYLSVESAPEKRTPATDGAYILVSNNGFVDVSNWTGSGNKILVPIPADNEVRLEGKCLGRRGAAKPETLGTFTSSAPKETWDGRRMELKPEGFTGYTIGYRIQPHGPATSSGFFNYTDYTIPSPSQPWITIEKSPNAAENEKLGRRPTLHWAWQGDPSKLTGFTILLDGKFFRSVPNWTGGTPGKWEQLFLLPTSCGRTYKFQVVANSGEAQSAPSAMYEYKQPPCEIYAEVIYETIEFTWLDDGEAGDCDNVEIYFTFFADPAHPRSFYSDSHPMKLGCGTYSLDMLTRSSPQANQYDSPPNTFIAPIDPANPFIRLWALFTEDDDFVLDQNDHLCSMSKTIKLPQKDWGNYSETVRLRCGEGVTSSSGFDGDGYITIRIRGFRAPPSGP